MKQLTAQEEKQQELLEKYFSGFRNTLTYNKARLMLAEYAAAHATQSAQQTGEVYRWVSEDDRLPTKAGTYFVKYYSKDLNERWGAWIDFDGKAFDFGYDVAEIEWLEQASPLPIQTEEPKNHSSIQNEVK
jgi:hypothetical protein